ncbi:Aldo/keto reductase [Trametes versicolor FP-101664 SS1]|uniref:Aldo/keto reductase n=1 Tax=Trametes versicolor (strain FP-101664) TaxID=717944 RepID=UPI000462301B|nr:Aldo/keto reductase [Trametes versicolor FP-101664 SS1]EIW53073.1 Aldo/keto reductase [Trametes versicolor FP-101664 SS1]
MTTHALTLASTIRLSSGYEMPLVGFGVWQNIDQCIPACAVALKHGYRHIDSARVYGNEVEVGQAVRDSGIPREDIFVTSKILHTEHEYERTLAAVDESLKRFGFDYLDLFLVHTPLSGKARRLETYRALLDAKKAGKLRSVGVSNYGVGHLEEIREAGLEPPAVNQLEIHPFCQQREIVEYCTERGIVLQAYCPLIQGQFDNPVFHEVAKKYNKLVPQVLVRWSLQKGFNPLPKSATPERIVSNVDVFDFEIAPEDMARIDALDKGAAGAILLNPVNAP